MRAHCIRRAVLSLAAVVGACALYGTAFADSYSVSGSAPTEQIFSSDVISVPQFDSTKGTLTSVSVSMAWSMMLTDTYTSTSSTTSYYYADIVGAVDCFFPGTSGTYIEGDTPPLIMGSTDGNGNPTYAIPPYGTLNGSQAGSGTIANNAAQSDLGLYIGTGNVSFNLSPGGTETSEQSGGNYIETPGGSWSATVTVTYTYNPPALGLVTQTCIQGTIYNNKCGDGVCGHTGESGLCSGIKVNCYDYDDNLLGSCFTDSNGCYEIDNICCNKNCKVQCDPTTLPTGFNLSCSSNTLTITTPLSGCSVGIDFAAVKCNNSGSFKTCCQEDWCGSPLLDLLKLDCLDLDWCKVYPPDRCLTIGCPTSNCCLFDSAACVLRFLTQSGSCIQLPLGCILDCPDRNLGTLCGEVSACKLNCDFSDAGCFRSGIKNLVCQTGKFAGCTVEQVLTIGNCLLSGLKPCAWYCPKNICAADVCSCLHSINCCYRNGANTGFCK